ncbi:cation diffusion facilitator 1 [Westerdykella ornata]|uniref:Cation diffusion facilitator 1 n=1 Tax=Westerdykella ornata TaxID=318751 RepID=A0A6A6JJM8_WESOR|nr:cation diffusion facilitator 1 [Westerdykella ornata]KAF2276791.1 cation diffusion facilitator 1 [Westerdykella ornata]
METDPDVHRAISLKPSPFHAYPPRAERDHSPRPSTTDRNVAKTDGTSTALETGKGTDEHDAHARHVAGRESDVERQTLPHYTPDNDPYRLAAALKPQAELERIRANTSRKRDGFGPITLNRAANRARKLEKFYEKQNENIERLLKPVDDHRRDAKEEEGANHLKYRIAVVGSFVANVLLAIIQLYAAVSSLSLSLFTTMADSLFDPLSNLTLILCARAVKRVDGRKFPSGKARIETAGNIFFCFLMITVSVVIIVESIRELATHIGGEVNGFYLPSVIAVCIAFTTKFSLFLYCWAIRNKYSQVRILWEDHRNDLFINGFGILTSVGGAKLKWWIDPMGAIVLSVLIIFLWSRTAYSEFQLLIGVSADTHMLQLITYISMTHSPAVLGIDTVRAYHSGPRLIVEVDIVMDPEETLRATHDIAEELQIKLESLPNVERAYVHVDYETSHAPEHFLKKEL